MPQWLEFSSIDFDCYDLPEDINAGDWNYLLNDLKEDYATYRGWDDNFWYDDNDKLYAAECEAYEIIAKLREKFD